MPKKDNLVVGLDIGTTKVCAVVGEITNDGVDIIGIGSYPSRGIKKGVIVNIEATVEAISRAVEDAEFMAGCDILSVYASISGGHIRGVNSHGVVSVRNKTILTSDIERVIDSASALLLGPDREVIHVVPQSFVVDHQDCVTEPLGMAGVKFEAYVHIVHASVSCLQNITKCANRKGITVNDIVLSQFSSAEACVSLDERELGVVLVDIGGGTTDIAVYVDGSIAHSVCLPLGGNHITNDIAVGLRTPAIEAEKIKLKYGCALASLVQKDETIDVPSVGGRKPRILSRQILAQIIEPRVEEIFDLVKKEIVKSGCEDKIASGVVLTGGTSILEGAPELAEQVFDFPVRRAVPRAIGGLVDVVKSPMYATGVGLVLYGSQRRQEQQRHIHGAGVFGKAREKVKAWFTDMF